jgi:hypothetical protein
MALKVKLMAAGATLAGMTRNALAAANTSGMDVSLERGRANVMSLQYADKAQWILDSMYFLIDLFAKFALLYLVIRVLLGGWDNIEAELKGRRAFTMVIVILAALKIGMMLINVILSW